MSETTKTYWNVLAEVHGPFHSKEGCLVLEISYPSQTASLLKNTGELPLN